MEQTFNAVSNIFGLNSKGTINRGKFVTPDGLCKSFADNYTTSVARRPRPTPPRPSSLPSSPTKPTSLILSSPTLCPLDLRPLNFSLEVASPLTLLHFTPNLEERIALHGQFYDAICATRQTQWKLPLAWVLMSCTQTIDVSCLSLHSVLSDRRRGETLAVPLARTLLLAPSSFSEEFVATFASRLFRKRVGLSLAGGGAAAGTLCRPEGQAQGWPPR